MTDIKESFSVAMSPEDVDLAVAEANVPTLLAVLVQLSGDTTWLTDRYRPERIRGLSEDDSGGLSREAQTEVRNAAAGAITKWFAGEPVALGNAPAAFLRDLFSFTVGEEVPHEYTDYIENDLSAPLVGLPEVSQSLEGLTAVVIGAGVSGIAAAIRLRRLGADVQIVEKTTSIGGTWNINTYPGCGVDTPSHLYSYSFAPRDWTHYYASQPELKDYVHDVAHQFGVADSISFATEVTGARFDSDNGRWEVFTDHAESGQRTVICDVLISAVGAFGRPSIPNLDGLYTFQGELLHTAVWSNDSHLSGKRVGVIGTGASAMQFAPAVAEDCERLTVFQRSPQWAAPFEQFHMPVPDGVRRLIDAVPLYRSWQRARLGWLVNDKIHDSLQIDPEWPDKKHSINAINDAHRRFFTRYIESELGSDADELLPKVLPDYPPFGKRMLLDNGWFRMLRRDNVDLVADPIVDLDATGAQLANGTHVDLDVLVLATGFDVVHYLSPMRIEGVDGRVLSEVWDGDNARAYLGMTVPGFPNLFCFYGPNGAPGHGGSFINVAECQLNYMADLLIQMRSAGVDALSCRQDVHDEYNAKVDAANDAMIWSHPGVSTYYRNSRGRVVYTNPWRIVDYHRMTKHAELSDYDTIASTR
jgi:4-hydroxyacetophenone monooxygenase